MRRELAAILTIACAATGAALPASALGASSPSTRSVTESATTLPGSLTSLSPDTAAKNYYCFTGIDEPCAIIFNMGIGKAVAITYWGDGTTTYNDHDCPSPSGGCTVRFTAIPDWGDLVDHWRLWGPNIRHVEVK